MAAMLPYNPAAQRVAAVWALAGLLAVCTGVAAAIHLAEHEHAAAEHAKCQTCQLLCGVKQGIPLACAVPALLELSPELCTPAAADPAPLSRLAGCDKSARGPPALS
jgi:hypothetical protein